MNYKIYRLLSLLILVLISFFWDHVFADSWLFNRNNELVDESSDRAKMSQEDAEWLCIKSTWINISDKQVILWLSESDRLKFVYCFVNQYFWYYINVDKEEDFESKDYKEIKKASLYELHLLELKNSYLEEDWKTLWYDDRKKINELKSSDDCGWYIWEDKVSCLYDMRLFSYKIKDYGWFAKNSSLMKQWFINSVWWFVNGVLVQAWVWYYAIDDLPDVFSEDNDGSYGTILKSLLWNIHLFVLSVIWIFVIFFLFRRLFGKFSDSIPVFLLKLLLVFSLTFGFPFIYNSLIWLIAISELQMLDFFSWVEWVSRELLINWIQLKTFWDMYYYTIDTYLFFIPNIICLLFISFLVTIRDMFISIIVILFSVLTVWLVVWVYSKDNIFESQSKIAKISKWMIEILFIAISILLTLILHVITLKLFTVLLLFIPIPGWWSILDKVTSLWWYSFLYFVFVFLSIFYIKSRLYPIVKSFVHAYLLETFFSVKAESTAIKAEIESSKEWFSKIDEDEKSNMLKLDEPERLWSLDVWYKTHSLLEWNRQLLELPYSNEVIKSREENTLDDVNWSFESYDVFRKSTYINWIDINTDDWIKRTIEDRNSEIVEWEFEIITADQEKENQDINLQESFAGINAVKDWKDIVKENITTTISEKIPEDRENLSQNNDLKSNENISLKVIENYISNNDNKNIIQELTSDVKDKEGNNIIIVNNESENKDQEIKKSEVSVNSNKWNISTNRFWLNLKGYTEDKESQSISNDAETTPLVWEDSNNYFIEPVDLEDIKIDFENNVVDESLSNVDRVISNLDMNIFSDVEKEFLGKYAAYKKQKDSQDIQIFDSNSIVLELVKKNMFDVWDLSWISNDIDSIYDYLIDKSQKEI